MSKVYRNTGSWKGYLVETDNGTKIHVPSGKLGDFRAYVAEATQRRVDVYAGSTKIVGRNDGVELRDQSDSKVISDAEAVRLVNEVDRFIFRETAMRDLGNELK